MNYTAFATLLGLVQSNLKAFAGESGFLEQMQLAFGASLDGDAALRLAQAWRQGDFSVIPTIAFLPSSQLNGANGAYAAETGTIYLSQEWVAQQNFEAVVALVLEELGHHLDQLLNSKDSEGDEGAVFSALVRGESLTAEMLILLKAENDVGVIRMNGRAIAVEQATLVGDDGDNVITGTGEDDTISGGAGKDQLLGLGGNDALFGGEGNDRVDGGTGNDVIDAGFGQDTVVGGDGVDTLEIDYSTVTATEGSSGIFAFNPLNLDTNGYRGTWAVNKAGQLNYTDFYQIERFKITGTQLNDIFAGGNQADALNGEGGDDTIISDSRNDLIDGGDGFDTLDSLNFSDITNPLFIELKNGIFSTNVTDTRIKNIERFTNLTSGKGDDIVRLLGTGNDSINAEAGNDVIGAGFGQDTVVGGDGFDILEIDYSTVNPTEGGSGIFAYNPLNLEANGYRGTWAVNKAGQLNYTDFSQVEGFYITGTQFNDTFAGGNRGDILSGEAGNDIIAADAGNDIISGVSTKSAQPGLNEVDTLTGGAGLDRFLLGDVDKAYYDDGNTQTNGSSDYALITDFDPTQDKIQLKGSKSNYRLDTTPIPNVPAGTALYIDKPGSEPDELIAILQNQTNLDLQADYFVEAQPDIPPDPAKLSLTLAAPTLAESGKITATITRNTSTQTAIDVFLSSNTTQIQLPTKVTIPAGATSATFEITAPDDDLVEADQSISITASAANFLSDVKLLELTDNDRPQLTLTLAADRISESNGTTSLTISRDRATTQPLVVVLSSNQPGQVNFPPTVTIPANQTSIAVSLTAVQDGIVDGDQPITITAKPTYSQTSIPFDQGSATANLSILDTDKPILTLTINRNSISEKDGKGAAIATLRRNFITNSDLVVTLTSSDISEATVPPNVAIPANQAEVTFAIDAVNDGITDGVQSVTITASAPAFSSGVSKILVGDVDAPDLVVSQLTVEPPLLSGQPSFFNYRVENQGLATASFSTSTDRLVDRIYLSTDNRLDNNDTLLSEQTINAEVPVGQFYDRKIPFTAPRAFGQYFLIAKTDVTNAVNEGGDVGDGNNTTITPVKIEPSYRAIVSTETEVSPARSQIVLRGQAISNLNNAPVPYEFVTIAVKNKGFVRELSAFTDVNGNFTTTFNSLPNEGGTYQVNAYFPNNTSEDVIAEDSFKLLAMQFEASDATYKVIADQPFTAQTNLQNLTDLDLTGITTTVEGAPEDWTVQINSPAQLTGDNSNTIRYTITAPNASPITQDSFNIKLTSAEGVTATLPVNVNLVRNTPSLKADTTALSGGMLRGDQTFIEFEVTNAGGATAKNIKVVVPDAPWLKLVSPGAIASLEPGASTKVTLRLAPDANLPLAAYQGNIRLDAEGNDGDLSLPFTFLATSEAVGSIKINAVDELFYFTEGAPKLANATVILRNYFTNQEVRRAVTDDTGRVDWNGIPEGAYKLEVKAENHDSFSQVIQLEAGETETVNSFLSRQTVKYKWSVVPTEIKDKYNVIVTSKFETDVAVPTVVIEPPMLDLGDLKTVGQVKQVEMTVTNHGLIAANNVNLKFDQHPFYKIEPLIDNVESLSAKSTLKIPVRITRIADFNTLQSNIMPASETSSMLRASAPQPTVACTIGGSVGWSFLCGLITVGKSAPIVVNNVDGNCGGSPLPGGGVTGPRFPETPGEPGTGTVYSYTPVEVDLPNPCCLVPEIKFSADLGLQKAVEALAGRALEVIKDRLGLDLKKQLSVNAGIQGSIEPCCMDDSSELSIEASANAEVSLSLGRSVDIPATSVSYPIFDLSVDGGKVGLEVVPSLAGVAKVSKKCGEDWCIDASLTGGVTLFFGIEAAGSATLKPGIPPIGGNTEQKVSFTGAIIGQLSLSIGYDCEKGAFFNLSSEGLYIELQGTAFGQTVSPFDNPSTADVEIKRSIIEPFSIGNGSRPTESLQIVGSDSDSMMLKNSLLAASVSNLQGASEEEVERAVEADLQSFIQSWFAQTVQPNVDTILQEYSLPPSAVSFPSPDPNAPEMPPEQEESVCAKVRIQIDQDAVMTRAAFIGNLQIDNSNVSSLKNITVNLQVKDEQGNVVNNLFGIEQPTLSKITAIDGTGTLSGDDPKTPENEGIGSAEWTFVPTNLAAPDQPTQYSIGGTLSYIENDEVVTVPLLSSPITVYPQAELYLDYFQERNVYGDDPFTDTVEPSVPFSLGVLVRNEGKGMAKDLSIASGQPKIIENEKGLLIDFQIIGSQINGAEVSPSLKADFGDLEAGETAVADWLLQSSLQGKFTEYKATFEHVNALGNSELSLIKQTKIHELIHKVQVNNPTDDGRADFLVNDVVDPNFYPDTLYFSNGGTAPVNTIANAIADGAASPTDLQVQVTTTTQTGWSYVRLADPANGQFEIKSILRGDGTEIPLDNLWRTDRTFPATGRPTYENILHFLDYSADAGNQTYTVTYKNRTLPVNQPPVLAINQGLTLNESAIAPITSTQLQTTDADNTSSQLVYTLTSPPTHGTLKLSGTPLAANATFTQADIDNNRLSYIHDGSETTSDRLSFTVTDGADGIIIPTNFSITINPINDAPTLQQAIADAVAKQNTAFSFSIPDNTFKDVDAGDRLTYTASLDNGRPLPTWLSFNTTTKTFTGTPKATSDVGTFNIKVTATDLANASASDIFTLTVTSTNNPPIVKKAIANQKTKEDEPFKFTFATDIFSDPDVGDTLKYSATLADGSPLPTWLRFNPGNRTFIGTPKNAQVGTLDIKVIATDKAAATASTTFKLQVINQNDPPKAVDDSLKIENKATSIAAEQLLANDKDPDGNPLKIVKVDNAQNGVVRLKSNGDVVFTPLNSGRASFEYTISDGKGGSDTAKVRLNVIKQPNQIKGTNRQDTLVGTDEDDIITGYRERDTLTGKKGRDQFVFTDLRDARDTITDFKIGSDKIVLTELLRSIGYQGTNPIADGYVQIGASDRDSILQIDIDASGQQLTKPLATIQNVRAAQLNNVNNFIF